MSQATRSAAARSDARTGDAVLAAAELLVVGLPGPVLGAAERSVLERIRPGGVILFARNVESVEQLEALTAAVVAASPRTLLYSDSEGGRVDRLAPLVGPAPAGATLAAAPPRLARRAGRWVGEALAHFGYHVDFAPVVDLERGNAGNALDGRPLGATPDRVVARGRAFLEGLHAAGVGGCLKHFPGLGPTRGDTHVEAGRAPGLDAVALADHLAPFRHLGEAAGMVMVAHAIYPGLDPDTPASVSPRVLELLRGDGVGFSGLAVADDLEMEALAPVGGLAERAAACLAAGCDLLPLCHSLQDAPAVAEHLAATPALAGRIAEARRRLARYRRHLDDLGRSRRRRHRLDTVRRRLAETGARADEAAAG